MANIEANLVKITHNEMDVNSSLRSLCNQFRLKADEKGIQLSFETTLLDSASRIIVDSTKLIQIISNLVNNALKFTDKGEVKVSLKKTNAYLEFSVSDTGIGISQEHHSRIFERFFQVQNSESRLFEGTGLGLSISKAYVELMGGSIWLSSEPGNGTTFSLLLPYVPQTIAKVPEETKSGKIPFMFKTKRRVLIAEDVESNFKLIRYFLAGTNTEIIRAQNGKEAVEKFKSEGQIDLILMDIKMPVMDGYEAVKIIRESGAKLPIIAQTAYANEKEKSLESGCNGFISKPFDRQTLLNAMSEFI